jgi:enolase-phosphatase E1
MTVGPTTGPTVSPTTGPTVCPTTGPTTNPTTGLTTGAVVVDIEGTTSSISHVHDHLFPYSRERLPDWLAEHADRPEVAQALDDTRRLADRPNAGTAELVAVLRAWIDEDRKATPLKTIQGLIWADGYAAGVLRSHVYDDVPPALLEWTGAGLPVFVYSSGSVAAQRQWFTHCPQGDLLSFFSGHFDTANAGPKRETASYRRIADLVGLPGGRLLFLSDVRAELDAASEVGWQVVGVRRDGAPPIGGGHREITSFAEIQVRGPHSSDPLATGE